MQVMAPQALTAAQARWKSANQLCKLLTHDLLLLRSSCMHCACPLFVSLSDGFCPLDRCVCSSDGLQLHCEYSSCSSCADSGLESIREHGACCQMSAGHNNDELLGISIACTAP
jgi:hypothetical protein